MSEPNTPEAVRTRWWARAFPLALAVCVAAAGVASLAALRGSEHAVRARTAQLSRIASYADRLEGLQGRLALEQFQHASPDATFRTARLFSARIRAETAAVFPGAERAPRGSVAREVNDDVDAIVTSGMRALQYVVRGNYGPNLERMTVRLVASEDALRRVITKEGGRLAKKTDTVEHRTAIGTIATVVAMLALLVLIGVGTWRAERRRDRIQRAQLEAREVWFRALIEWSSDLILVVDEHASVTYVAAGGADAVGLGSADLLGRDIGDLLLSSDVAQFRPMWADLLERPGGQLRVDVAVRAPDDDGRKVELEAIARNLLHDDVVRGVVVNARDVTARRRLEHLLVHRAFRDDLTGLPNRAQFLDRLDHALSIAHRTGERVAVLFLDLDGFKTVNDTLGHAAGDEVLRQVADRLRGAVRPSDTAARLAGDEFVVLLEEVEDEADALDAATRIERALAEPMVVADQPVRMGVSVGIAFGAPDEHAGDVLRAADTAMYEAKTARRSAIVMFEPEMADRAWSRLRAGTAVDRLHRKPA